LQPADWPAILALDGRAFGAYRGGVVQALARRLPQAALVAERDGGLTGYLLGRDGRAANQLGPLVACDALTARALLAAALGNVTAPIYVDLADREAALHAWLASGGFVVQRPFTRMVHGTATAPGEERLVFCPAGPELG
jgi:hypothetical protein